MKGLSKLLAAVPLVRRQTPQVPVQATYDGFSRRYNTYAYATETLEDGLAYAKVNNPGIWMVRVEKRIEEPTKDYDLYSLKATLVFAVQ
jgi:hypothetical protein